MPVSEQLQAAVQRFAANLWEPYSLIDTLTDIDEKEQYMDFLKLTLDNAKQLLKGKDSE